MSPAPFIQYIDTDVSEWIVAAALKCCDCVILLVVVASSTSMPNDNDVAWICICGGSAWQQNIKTGTCGFKQRRLGSSWLMTWMWNPHCGPFRWTIKAAASTATPFPKWLSSDSRRSNKCVQQLKQEHRHVEWDPRVVGWGVKQWVGPNPFPDMHCIASGSGGCLLAALD